MSDPNTENDAARTATTVLGTTIACVGCAIFVTAVVLLLRWMEQQKEKERMLQYRFDAEVASVEMGASPFLIGGVYGGKTGNARGKVMDSRPVHWWPCLRMSFPQHSNGGAAWSQLSDSTDGAFSNLTGLDEHCGTWTDWEIAALPAYCAIVPDEVRNDQGGVEVRTPLVIDTVPPFVQQHVVSVQLVPSVDQQAVVPTSSTSQGRSALTLEDETAVAAVSGPQIETPAIDIRAVPYADPWAWEHGASGQAQAGTGLSKNEAGVGGGTGKGSLDSRRPTITTTTSRAPRPRGIRIDMEDCADDMVWQKRTYGRSDLH